MKIVIRRAVKPQPGCGVEDYYHRPDGLFQWLHLPRGRGVGIGLPFLCPYGQPGDRLSIKESLRGEVTGVRIERVQDITNPWVWVIGFQTESARP